MADNTDYLPLFGSTLQPNERTDVIIRGSNNAVAISAKSVFVSGDLNYVGDDCANVTILNSSGCVVSSGIVGATIINSSGIVIEDPDLVYINNILYSTITGGGVTYFGYRKVTSNSTITTSDGTIEARGGTDHDLPVCLGHNKMFNIKNYTGGNINVNTFGSDTIDNDPSGSLIVADGDSVTVQSDGISNYLIL